MLSTHLKNTGVIYFQTFWCKVVFAVVTNQGNQLVGMKHKHWGDCHSSSRHWRVMASIKAFDFSVEIHSYPWGRISRRKYFPISRFAQQLFPDLSTVSHGLFLEDICVFTFELSRDTWASSLPSITLCEVIHNLVIRRNLVVVWMYRVRCEWKHFVFTVAR